MLIALALAAMLLSSTDPDMIAKGNFFGEPQEREFGRWRLIQQGLEGGLVSSLQFVDDNTILAGTNVGAFRSTDGGINWTSSRLGLPEQSGTAIAAVPSDPLTYYAAGNRGVFRSGDAGATWLPANTGIEFEQMRVVAVDPSDSNHVYVAPSDDRIFITSNAGDSWTGVGLGLSDASSISAIAVDPVDGNTLYVGIQAFGGGDQGVYKSSDGGSSFVPVNNGLMANAAIPGIGAIAVDPNDRNTLFAGASCGGVFRSQDAGANWTQVDTDVCTDALAIDPDNSQRILSDQAISTDGGDSWQAIAPFSGPDDVASVAIQPGTGHLFAGAKEAGVARSLDGGAIWVVFSSGLDAGIASDVLALDKERLFAAVNRTGVFGSTDAGQSWQLMGQRFDVRFTDIAVAPSDPDTIYVGTRNNGVIASFDGGASWNFRNTGIETESVVEIAVAPDDPNRLYAATDTFGASVLEGTVWISADAGLSWAPSGLALSEVEVQAIVINPTDSMQLFAGISAPDGPVAQAVYVSNDAGLSWQQTDPSINTGNGIGVFALAIDSVTPTTLYAATAGTEGVFKSLDSGGTWTPLAGSGDTLFDLAIHPTNPQRLFSSAGLLSLDGGASWETVEPNSPFHQSVSMNPADINLLYNPGLSGAQVRNIREARIALPVPAATDFGDRFGSQVVVQGNTIIVGSPGSDASGPDSGVVHVFRRSGSEVTLEQTIPVPDTFLASSFGAALAIDGDRLVIGAPAAGAIAKGNTLRAAIFARLAQGWTFKQALTPQAGGDEFGAAVAIDGDMIVIGAPGDADAGVDAGAAHVFQFDGADAVEMLPKLTPTMGSSNAAFGTAVSIANGKVAIGAPGSIFNGVNSGRVSLLQMVGANLEPLADIGPGAADAEDRFGTSVALNGDMLAIGVPGDDSVTADTGAIEMFRFAPTGATALGRVRATVADSGSGFGQAVAFDGENLMVGAPTGRSDAGRLGAAFVFAATQNFALTDHIVPEDGNSMRFGFSVAVDATELVVGAPFSDSEIGTALLITNADQLFESSFER